MVTVWLSHQNGRLPVPLIDQRILIDAPPQMIWDFISDPGKLTRWHAGYSGVSVLTTQRTGSGTRRRCSPAGGGKDVIEEITAWVEGLGYEYSVVDGGRYRALQGRLRLQPGPDGTTVQWTITYRPRGLFGLLRDQLSGRRQLAQMMADSLRQLRRQVDLLGVRMDEAQRAKMSIQGRLDANARAQYQRRYAPPPGLETAEPDTEITPAAANGDQPIDAPPAEPDVPVPAVPSFVADLADNEAVETQPSHKADTQPRPPEGLHEAIAEQEVAGEQEEFRPAEPEITVADTQPTTPERIEPPSVALPVQPPVFRESAVRPAEPEHMRITPPHGIPVVRPSVAVEPPSDEIPTKPKPPRETDAPGDVESDRHAATLPPQTPIHDTGEISIWEVFGVKRPSEQDDENLEDLIRSVRRKQSDSRRRVGRRIPKRTMLARRADTVVGLRVWLALRAAQIRHVEGLYRDGE
jgi:uncharacterized protein YndB with AHSA1/START domain